MWICVVVGRGTRPTVGWLEEQAIFFGNSGCLIFGTFRVEASISMPRYAAS